MKTLPRNICAHPDGYLVRIVRGDLKWSAFVPYSYGQTEFTKLSEFKTGHRPGTNSVHSVNSVSNPALAEALRQRDVVWPVHVAGHAMADDDESLRAGRAGMEAALEPFAVGIEDVIEHGWISLM